MNRVTATVRLTIGLVTLSLSILFAAATCGLIADPQSMQLQARAKLCEAMAISSSALMSDKTLAPVESHLELMLKRNPDLTRVVLERDENAILDIRQPYETMADPNITPPAPISFPLYRGRTPWGSIHFYYAHSHEARIARWVVTPFARLSVFVAAAAFGAYYFFLRRMLQRLDPTKAVPDRVRSALNTLAEGLIILDEKERIVMANDAFAKYLNKKNEELLGKSASKLGWSGTPDAPLTELPWTGSLKRSIEQNGVPLMIDVGGEEPRIFRVNSTPVFDSKGKGRGALATFTDITAIEKSRNALRKMLEELCVSRDEIKRQNRELQILATRDPLTGCFNRRSFFEQFETQWGRAGDEDSPLSCAMVDVDHFKSINDNHGHAVGDKVLQGVGGVLRKLGREEDVVCRYGGEEFAVLMPRTTLADAALFAESLRTAIAEMDFGEVRVTASLGVATRCELTADPHSMLNEADKCLYAAKRNGRNRVVRRDELPDDLAGEAPLPPSSRRGASPSISFQAVTALFSALAYRDHNTAEHNRRVADLAVSLGNGLMPKTDLYVLEIAALMHDIGKLGVPDAILLKRAPLTEEEWQIMSRHDRIGVEIIHSAFGCERLTEIIRCLKAWFGGRSTRPDLPVRDQIPLAARVLQIADAYDSMVSVSVYRRSRTQAEAFEELRRCAGTQFDPELVERFISVIHDQDQSARPPQLNNVSKQFALQVGTEMERLAETIDGRDLHGLETLASRLKETAETNGVAEIATLAGKLEKSAKDHADLESVLALTQELLLLCRSTQRAFLAESQLTISG